MASITVRPSIGNAFTIPESLTDAQAKLYIEANAELERLRAKGWTREDFANALKQLVTDANTRNTRESKTPCMIHDGNHAYLQHGCGHLYCPQYWRSCPRCFGSDAGNRFESLLRAELTRIGVSLVAELVNDNVDASGVIHEVVRTLEHDIKAEVGIE